MNKFLRYMELLKKYNTLENKYEVLKEAVKSDLYETFMAKLGEPIELKRLRKKNQRLRKHIKSLKETIKNN